MLGVRIGDYRARGEEKHDPRVRVHWWGEGVGEEVGWQTDNNKSKMLESAG